MGLLYVLIFVCMKKETCPVCSNVFAQHTDSEMVSCARALLSGARISNDDLSNSTVP